MNKGVFLLPLLLLSLIACRSSATSDEAIQQKINDAFKHDQAGAVLNATVDNGVVTVSGQCTGDSCAARLAEKLKKMNGVKGVEMRVIEQ